jgi:hypothetical protein
MDFGRKAWNTFQHMPEAYAIDKAWNGTKSPPTMLQGKRLSGNTSRRVMDFGRKAWNTFQHMPEAYAIDKAWNTFQHMPQETSARDYVDWLTAQRQQK